MTSAETQNYGLAHAHNNLITDPKELIGKALNGLHSNVLLGR